MAGRLDSPPRSLRGAVRPATHRAPWLAVLAACGGPAPGPPALGPAASPSASSADAGGPATAAGAWPAAAAMTSAATPAPTGQAVTASGGAPLAPASASAADRLDERPSARCVAECNRPRPGSMCAFCTSHQIGAPREHFEEFARRCSETCDREVRACWQACEGRGQRPR